MAKTEYDLCVIGGGTAGLVCAAGAATLGAKVVLLEKHRLGGDCLYTGCVPSKTLLHSAQLAQQMRLADRFGLPSYQPETRLAAVMARVSEVIKTIEPHDSPERFRALGVEVVFGQAGFASKQLLAVDGRDIRARRYVIATGSRPRIPPVPGLEAVPYLTNETIFQQTEPVDHLIVIGGGPIGVELAQAFIRLGSAVTVITRDQHLLSKEDVDLAEVVEAQLKSEGIRIYFNAEIKQIKGTAGNILVETTAHGGETLAQGSHLLIATGRISNTETLGLKNAGVIFDQRGVTVNDRMRTSNRRIYACGDVVNRYQFTHMAEHMAGVVLRNALFHLPAKVEQRVIPWCTFTDPELARVGLSETEARQQKIKHQVYRFPMQEIDRALTDGVNQGMAKIVIDKRGRILGAALVAAHAGELIHEYVLALYKKMKLSELSGIIHIYPTLAQINRRVADQRLKQQLTPGRKKWLKRLLGFRGT